MNNLSLIYFTQCTVYNFSNLRFSGFFCHSMSNTAINIRNLETFNTIMSDIGNQIHIVYIKLTILFSFSIDFPEEFNLCVIEIFSNFLYHPYIPEEFCT